MILCAMAETKFDPLQGLVLALFEGEPPPLSWAVEWGAHGDPVTEAWNQSSDAASMAMVLLYTMSVRDAVARIARAFRATPLAKPMLYLSGEERDYFHNIDLLAYSGPTGQYIQHSGHEQGSLWDASMELFEARASWIDTAAGHIGMAVSLFRNVCPDSELRDAMRLEGPPVFEDVMAALEARQ